MASHSEIRNACCVEYAKSNRSNCVKCRQAIRQGEVRVGQQFHADHDGYRYYHIKCFKKPPAFTNSKDFFFGFESLKPKDQTILENTFNVSGSTPAEAPAGHGRFQTKDEKIVMKKVAAKKKAPIPRRKRDDEDDEGSMGSDDGSADEDVEEEEENYDEKDDDDDDENEGNDSSVEELVIKKPKPALPKLNKPIKMAKKPVKFSDDDLPEFDGDHDAENFDPNIENLFLSPTKPTLFNPQVNPLSQSPMFGQLSPQQYQPSPPIKLDSAQGVSMLNILANGLANQIKTACSIKFKELCDKDELFHDSRYSTCASLVGKLDQRPKCSEIVMSAIEVFEIDNDVNELMDTLERIDKSSLY